ncbi:type II toxin-antitoxin system Phd/YefM family antitoxin [Mumia sp. zg.B17]|uniref:type II toxin-antitoxin system Phd/YefM family antitoxin n=1 Tax=Mumia sp. zg.B17 TaxID=2855446 RepID=UPI001C6F1A63|nr:type II toxin-antitoxin system Phd/YefM family antitoxin [Mumia sp. zg.B17]MBW9207976.1 type II toxin-antitoxin system Phd/YefM family antitoxin [Mumia sp. zg.B17]
MDTISGEVSARELRAGLPDVIGRAAYGHERVAITRHGKVTAVVIGVEDFEALEAFELARDVAELRAAKADDDGQRVSLEALRTELAE